VVGSIEQFSFQLMTEWGWNMAAV